MSREAVGASFRDPSGFVFEQGGALFRQINRSYAADYDHLMGSGLYDALVEQRLLIPHQEVEDGADANHHRTLRPEPLAFVSYPYEWSFSQLKDAALTTLRVQREAMRFGMTLKDANAANIQFHRGRPVLIDTLSFERYVEGAPWTPYRQFCQHFLAPLALAAYRDVRLLQLLRVHLDGVPLDLASSLLPARARLDPHLVLHVFLHARAQRRYRARGGAARPRRLDRKGLENVIRALRAAVSRLRWRSAGSEWSAYYEGDSYEATAFAQKKALVAGYLERIAPAAVWDLGANTGVFSRIAAERGAQTLAFDADPACVDQLYREIRKREDTRILPLLLDVTNPSPGLGWAHAERASLLDRRAADAVLALALVHHLAIANNVPLDRVAALFARLAPWLIVEFVPKSDPKVELLLATREDVFPDYTREGFEAAFATAFETLESDPIEGSGRILYRMRRRVG